MKKKKLIISVIIIGIIFVAYYVQISLYLPEGKIFQTDIYYQTDAKCRDGLTILGYYKVPNGISKAECIYYRPEGSLNRVCSNCGNGNCEEWENICTCLEDCE